MGVLKINGVFCVCFFIEGFSASACFLGVFYDGRSRAILDWFESRKE